MLHYTNKVSWNSIRSQVNWTFKTHKPPGVHPAAAYFTTLPPDARNLASRLGIPATKVEYVFCFRDAGDLKPIPGDRGKFILFSDTDYIVFEERQHDCGPRDEANCK
jgi:hypothetical protein